MESATNEAQTRYYSESEVSVHNVYNDAWVSLFGKVLNITDLIRQCLGSSGSYLATPLVQFAGQDITHWFDIKSLNVKTHVDPVSSLIMPFTPYGRFIHVPPNDPSANWNTNFQVPWWQDEQYIIGTLSKKSRNLRVVNMLTHQTHVFEVCSEETIKAVQARYLQYNAHASSYTWKRLGRVLGLEDWVETPAWVSMMGCALADLHKTLVENGIEDESDEFESLGINEQHHLPCLQLYYNDDLSVA